jgi:hypothetical protein
VFGKLVGLQCYLAVGGLLREELGVPDRKGGGPGV